MAAVAGWLAGWRCPVAAQRTQPGTRAAMRTGARGLAGRLGGLGWVWCVGVVGGDG